MQRQHDSPCEEKEALINSLELAISISPQAEVKRRPTLSDSFTKEQELSAIKKLLEKGLRKRSRPFNFLMIAIMTGTSIYLIKTIAEFYIHKHNVDQELLQQLLEKYSSIKEEFDKQVAALTKVENICDTLADFIEADLQRLSHFFEYWLCPSGHQSIDCSRLINSGPGDTCFISKAPDPTCIAGQRCPTYWVEDVCSLKRVFYPQYEKRNHLAELTNSLWKELKVLGNHITEMNPTFSQWVGDYWLYFVAPIVLGEAAPFFLLTFSLLYFTFTNCFKRSWMCTNLDTEEEKEIITTAETYHLPHDQSDSYFLMYQRFKTEHDRVAAKLPDCKKRLAFCMASQNDERNHSPAKILFTDPLRSGKDCVQLIFEMMGPPEKKNDVTLAFRIPIRNKQKNGSTHYLVNFFKRIDLDKTQLDRPYGKKEILDNIMSFVGPRP